MDTWLTKDERLHLSIELLALRYFELQSLHCQQRSQEVPRQKTIAFGKLRSKCFGLLDLFVEELVERINQILWWALLDDVPHFHSKAHRSESSE